MRPRKKQLSPRARLALLREHKTEIEGDIRHVSRFGGEEPRTFRDGLKRELAKVEAEIDDLEASANPKGTVAPVLTGAAVGGAVVGALLVLLDPMKARQA